MTVAAAMSPIACNACFKRHDVGTVKNSLHNGQRRSERSDEDVIWGVNAWPSNTTDQRRYRQEQTDVDY